MKEIEKRIEALTKMLGRGKEYDQGLLEGISALEDLNEILGKKVAQNDSDENY